MKKKIIGIVLVALVACLLFGGFCSRSAVLVGLYEPTYQYYRRLKESIGNGTTATVLFDGFSDYTKELENIFSEKLSYHNLQMNINSLYYRLSNKKEFIKEGSSYYLSEGGAIVVRDKKQEQPSEFYVQSFLDLQKASEQVDAKFLYVAIPKKACVAELPDYLDNYALENYNAYLSSFEEAGIPCLNLKENMDAAGLFCESSYFYTDHHWTPKTGLWATGEICKALQEAYGFDYNEEAADPKSYDITVYEDSFLGSYGKKIGKYFSSVGADDLEVYSPEFNTDLTEITYSQGKTTERNGDFDNTVIHMDRMQVEAYMVYSGWNYRLQVVQNHLNENGKKILIVRDSFGCVLTPFLSLQASELHIIDNRKSISSDARIDIASYIEEVQPDYVIVMFAGYSDERFAFK